MTAAVLVLYAGWTAAYAQTQGTVRAQGRDVGGGAQEAPSAGPAQPFFDVREEMRKFVQDISTFAKSYNPNFVVLTQNGLELVTKQREGDEDRVAPARTYMLSIDAILQEALYYGVPEPDAATKNDRREKLLRFADTATKNGIKVLVMDYARSRAAIDDSYRLSDAKGFVPFVAEVPAPITNDWPAYPERPLNENPSSIVSLNSVENFLYLRDSTPFGRQDEFVLTLHGTNYDMVVVDVFHGRKALSKQAVETLKFKKLGARRLVLAYVNIAAAAYRYYWGSRWREGSPIWISAPLPQNPDQYFVEYWRPEWQSIISGNTESYVYGVIDQGFDGVVLDGVESYRYFEGGLEAVEAAD
jgi:cysteinyl-tRNA synthetase